MLLQLGRPLWKGDNVRLFGYHPGLKVKTKPLHNRRALLVLPFSRQKCKPNIFYIVCQKKNFQCLSNTQDFQHEFDFKVQVHVIFWFTFQHHASTPFSFSPYAHFLSMYREQHSVEHFYTFRMPSTMTSINAKQGDHSAEFPANTNSVSNNPLH